MYCVDRNISTSAWLKTVKIAEDCQSSNVELASDGHGLYLRSKKKILKGETLSMWFEASVLALLDMPYLTHLNIQGNFYFSFFTTLKKIVLHISNINKSISYHSNFLLQDKTTTCVTSATSTTRDQTPWRFTWSRTATRWMTTTCGSTSRSGSRCREHLLRACRTRSSYRAACRTSASTCRRRRRKTLPATLRAAATAAFPRRHRSLPAPAWRASAEVRCPRRSDRPRRCFPTRTRQRRRFTRPLLHLRRKTASALSCLRLRRTKKHL